MHSLGQNGEEDKSDQRNIMYNTPKKLKKDNWISTQSHRSGTCFYRRSRYLIVNFGADSREWIPLPLRDFLWRSWIHFCPVSYYITYTILNWISFLRGDAVSFKVDLIKLLTLDPYLTTKKGSVARHILHINLQRRNKWHTSECSHTFVPAPATC